MERLIDKQNCITVREIGQLTIILYNTNKKVPNIDYPKFEESLINSALEFPKDCKVGSNDMFFFTNKNEEIEVIFDVLRFSNK